MSLGLNANKYLLLFFDLLFVKDFGPPILQVSNSFFCCLSEKNGSQEHLETSVALEEFMRDILEQETDDVKEGVTSSVPETVDELSVGEECDNRKRSSKASGEEHNTPVDHVIEYLVDNADLDSVYTRRIWRCCSTVFHRRAVGF